jgi:hypothetical protein
MNRTPEEQQAAWDAAHQQYWALANQPSQTTMGSAYTNAGGGLSGVGGVVGALGKTAYDGLGFLGKTAYDGLSALGGSAIDFADGISSGFTGNPVLPKEKADTKELDRLLGNATIGNRWSETGQSKKTSNAPPSDLSLDESLAIAREIDNRGKSGFYDEYSYPLRPIKEEKERRALSERGFRPVEQDYIASGNTPPADIYYKEEDGKTRYEIPGLNAIGGGPGYAEFQGKRVGGGSFSVVPGLSQYERKQLAEIEGREKRQRERNELASFMNQFTQPPGDMNPLQAKLWELQQQQLQHFVNAQTEAAQQTRLAEIKAAQDQAAARQAQAQWEAEHGLRQQVEQAKAVNDGMSMRNQALHQAGTLGVQQQRHVEKVMERYSYPDMVTQRNLFDAESFNKQNSIMEKPADSAQMIPDQMYYDPATGMYVGSDVEGRPILMAPDEMIAKKLGYL